MHSREILQPVVVLVAWTLVMMVWMIVVRTPAMKKAGIDVSKISGSKPGALDGVIEDKAQWPAHNYMHLVEQPTLFYAIALLLAIEGQGGSYNLILAWAYVGLRIVHSLIQATFNRVIVRFAVFMLASLALAALTVHAGFAVWHVSLH
jgi:hypothetical protein